MKPRYQQILHLSGASSKESPHNNGSVNNVGLTEDLTGEEDKENLNTVNKPDIFCISQ